MGQEKEGVHELQQRCLTVVVLCNITLMLLLLEQAGDARPPPPPPGDGQGGVEGSFNRETGWAPLPVPYLAMPDSGTGAMAQWQKQASGMRQDVTHMHSSQLLPVAFLTALSLMRSNVA